VNENFATECLEAVEKWAEQHALRGHNIAADALVVKISSVRLGYKTVDHVSKGLVDRVVRIG
jgi:hypothetical protein